MQTQLDPRTQGVRSLSAGEPQGWVNVRLAAEIGPCSRRRGQAF